MIRIIENSTLEFAENLAKLEKTLFSTTWDGDTINDKINRGEFLYWVYEQDDKIVGYLAIQKTLNDLHILGIGVLKDYRNQSIARNLTEKLISYFEISQFEKILLEVRESNEPATNLYQSFGFKQYGVRKNYYVNEDAKLFQREKIYA
jgi:ribosomal-protein-alanine N-acetyltransferase